MANATVTSPLAPRIELALQQGRNPQALELAKQLVKQEPGDASQALLRRCYLASATAQVARGSFRDAHSILSEAESISIDDPAWWERLAEMRADLGDHARALQLLEKVPGTTMKPRILGRLVDRAMKEGPAGKTLLPADLHPPFDAIRKAFAAYESKRDEDARTELNAIGLGSPFLEWKLLLRGLMAWSTDDSARANENWSRLTPERLPAQIAAPFRVVIDKSYAANLSPKQAALVADQSTGLTGGLVDGLRRVRQQMGSVETFDKSLEIARTLVPEMQRLSPPSVPRFASIMYHAMIGSADPSDLPRYQRIFGLPPDDPGFYRLQALITEGLGELSTAHEYWKNYAAWIAKSPDRWPGAQGNRARAIILNRMGGLATRWVEEEDDDDLDFFGSIFNRRPPAKKEKLRPLFPAAEECYREASDLANDWPEPLMHLLEVVAANKTKSLAVIGEALRKFPNDIQLLMLAMKTYEAAGEPAKAHECFRKAIAANPLDRTLREKGASLALSAARGHAEKKKYPAAFTALKEALDFSGGNPSPAALALGEWIEALAKVPEPERTHGTTLVRLPHARIAGPYCSLVEATRLKFKKPDLEAIKAAYAEKYAVLADATLLELTAWLDAMMQYRQIAKPYTGQKAHENVVLDSLGLAWKGMPVEACIQIGFALHRHKLWKQLKQLAVDGNAAWPNNPYFDYFLGVVNLGRQQREYISDATGKLFFQVIAKCAWNPEHAALLKLVEERKQEFPNLASWLRRRHGMSP